MILIVSVSFWGLSWVLPCLFSIYCQGLQETLKKEEVDLVIYADDTYVLVRGDNIPDIIKRSEETLKIHYDFLESVGMVVNKAKTEATIFNETKVVCHLRSVNDTIETLPEMKMLGLNFNHNLDWSKQVEKATAKARGCAKRLQIIRKFLTFVIALKLITPFYFSAVCYGLAVWDPRSQI